MSNSHKLQWNNATELQRKKRLDCLSKLCANQLDFKSTVPEKIVSEILNNKGIKYTKNAYLYNKFFVDFLLEDGRIIEVFGDYWHGNPDMFTTLNKQQQRQNNKDKSRLAYLKKCGHEIIVIWENRKGRHNYDEMKLFVDKNIHNSSSK
jgi:G:T-mismatch repair DNA endonuclease (very short patch repair protein)